MKILLLYNAFHDDLGSSRPPLGTGYIAQALHDKGIDYDVLDMKLGHSVKEVFKMIAANNYDYIGMTVYSVGHIKSFQFLGSVRERFPNIKIIVGGPHITLSAVKVLEKYSCIDVCFVGEAERNLVRLLSGDDCAKIPGIALRNNDGIVTTGGIYIEEDINSMSWPKYDKFELGKYANELGIITSRGCPYACIFCSVGLTLGKRVRARDVVHIGDELEYWYKRGKRIFNFLDDNLTYYRERVFNLCDEIDRRNLKGLVLRASNGLRADKLDRELLARMRSVGFRSFGIGVEAGNDRILSILKKGETLKQIEDTIKTCCDMGFEVSLFFVYGTPGESLGDIQDSIRLACKYPVLKVDFYNLIPFPGTELSKWVESNKAWTGDPDVLMNSMDKNLRFSRKSGRPFFVTEELDLKVREQLSIRLRKITLKVQRKGIEKALSCFGYLKYPMAVVASTTLFQRFLFGNNFIRKITDTFRYRKI